jgi:predicted dehydrogenase
MQTTALLGVAHIHVPAFIKVLNKRDDIQVRAVYDHDLERGQKRAGETNAAYTPSISDILQDREITSVIICSETARHLELVEAAAAAGKHIFVEKPLAITVEDAERMQTAVERAQVVFQTGFPLRGIPAMQFLKQEAAAGHLGTITRMRSSNSHGLGMKGLFDKEWNWLTSRELAGGGGFADLGAHSLDILLWTLSDVCGEVECVSASLGAAIGRYGDIDEYGAGLLRFSNGAIGIVEASWVDPKLRSPIELFGTEGQIQIINDRVFYYSEHVEGADGSEWEILPEAKASPLDQFFDCLEGKATNLVTVQEAARQSRVMAQLYQAAQSLVKTV